MEARARKSPGRIAPWLVAPAALLAAVLGGRFATALPASVFLWVAGVLVLAPVLWIAASALWPATAERRCPSCGREALVRTDPETAVGVRCAACGYRDDERSAWLLAEEEGPLEGIVLRQRARRRAPARRGLDSGEDPD